MKKHVLNLFIGAFFLLNFSTGLALPDSTGMKSTILVTGASSSSTLPLKIGGLGFIQTTASPMVVQCCGELYQKYDGTTPTIGEIFFGDEAGPVSADIFLASCITQTAVDDPTVTAANGLLAFGTEFLDRAASFPNSSFGVMLGGPSDSTIENFMALSTEDRTTFKTNVVEYISSTWTRADGGYKVLCVDAGDSPYPYDTADEYDDWWGFVNEVSTLLKQAYYTTHGSYFTTMLTVGTNDRLGAFASTAALALKANSIALGTDYTAPAVDHILVWSTDHADYDTAVYPDSAMLDFSNTITDVISGEIRYPCMIDKARLLLKYGWESERLVLGLGNYTTQVKATGNEYKLYNAYSDSEKETLESYVINDDTLQYTAQLTGDAFQSSLHNTDSVLYKQAALLAAKTLPTDPTTDLATLRENAFASNDANFMWSNGTTSHLALWDTTGDFEGSLNLKQTIKRFYPAFYNSTAVPAYVDAQ